MSGAFLQQLYFSETAINEKIKKHQQKNGVVSSSSTANHGNLQPSSGASSSASSADSAANKGHEVVRKSKSAASMFIKKMKQALDRAAETSSMRGSFAMGAMHPHAVWHIYAGNKSINTADTKPRTDNLDLVIERGGDRLGIEVDFADQITLLITRIEDGGAMAKYNEENPDNRLKPGDSILKVNGVRGGTDEMIEQIRKDGSLKLTIKKGTPDSQSGGTGLQQTLGRACGLELQETEIEQPRSTLDLQSGGTGLQQTSGQAGGLELQETEIEKQRSTLDLDSGGTGLQQTLGRAGGLELQETEIEQPRQAVAIDLQQSL